jgi:hypothetical protein
MRRGAIVTIQSHASPLPSGHYLVESVTDASASIDLCHNFNLMRTLRIKGWILSCNQWRMESFFSIAKTVQTRAIKDFLPPCLCCKANLQFTFTVPNILVTPCFPNKTVEHTKKSYMNIVELLLSEQIFLRTCFARGASRLSQLASIPSTFWSNSTNFKNAIQF